MYNKKINFVLFIMTTYPKMHVENNNKIIFNIIILN